MQFAKSLSNTTLLFFHFLNFSNINVCMQISAEVFVVILRLNRLLQLHPQHSCREHNSKKKNELQQTRQTVILRQNWNSVMKFPPRLHRQKFPFEQQLLLV